MAYAAQNALAGTIPHVGMLVIVRDATDPIPAVIQAIQPGQIDDITMWVFSEGRSRNNVTFANVAPDALTEGQWTWLVSV